jgi:DNA (cytosine-5)-methyltransferase 1
MRELALFAGAGGGILGGHLLGWRTVCAVEHDAYAASVLIARQNDRSLAPFPIWDDVCTFDGRPWRGVVDVVSGGFPCQDISVAGKAAGITGKRSGLWREMARIVDEVRPGYVFVENSPLLVRRGLAVVLGDLAALGYDARWGVLGARDVGAPHKRDRIWIAAADANSAAVRDAKQRATRRRNDVPHSGSTVAGDDGAKKFVADADSSRREKQRGAVANGPKHKTAECGSWWATEPDVGRVAHGVAARVDRLRCLGNGQVPAVAAAAWRMLQ